MYRGDAYLSTHLVLLLGSCYSICLSTRLLSLPIFKNVVHYFYCIFEKKHSLNKIYQIFNKMFQSCGRKSFNNTENPSAQGLQTPRRILSPLTQYCNKEKRPFCNRHRKSPRLIRLALLAVVLRCWPLIT